MHEFHKSDYSRMYPSLSKHSIEKIEAVLMHTERIREFYPNAYTGSEKPVDEVNDYPYSLKTYIPIENDFVTAEYSDYRKRYLFQSVHRFDIASHHQKGQATKHLVEPQHINVLTKNKIEQWLSYIDQCNSAHRLVNEETKLYQERTILELKRTGANFRLCDGYDKKGRLSRGGIALEFEICHNHLTTTMVFEYSDRKNEVEHFMLLSDNLLAAKVQNAHPIKNEEFVI